MQRPAPSPRRPLPALSLVVPGEGDYDHGPLSNGSPRSLTPRGLSMFCPHNWQTHKRRAFSTCACSRSGCQRRIGALASSIWKCTLCKAKMHQECVKPHDLIVIDGDVKPFSEVASRLQSVGVVRRGSLVVAPRGAPTPPRPHVPSADATADAADMGLAGVVVGGAGGAGRVPAHAGRPSSMGALSPTGPVPSPSARSAGGGSSGGTEQLLELAGGLPPVHTGGRPPPSHVGWASEEETAGRVLRPSFSANFDASREDIASVQKRMKRLNTLSPSVRRTVLLEESVVTDEAWPTRRGAGGATRPNAFRRTQSSPLALVGDGWLPSRPATMTLPAPSSWHAGTPAVAVDAGAVSVSTRSPPSMAPGGPRTPPSSLRVSSPRVALTQTAGGATVLPSADGGVSGGASPSNAGHARALVPSNSLVPLSRLVRSGSASSAGSSSTRSPAPSPTNDGGGTPRAATDARSPLAKGLARVMSDEFDQGIAGLERMPSGEDVLKRRAGSVGARSRSPRDMTRRDSGFGAAESGVSTIMGAHSFARSSSVGSSASESSGASQSTERVVGRVDIPRPSDVEARSAKSRLDRSYSGSERPTGLHRKRSPLHAGSADLHAIALRSVNPSLGELKSATHAVRRGRRSRSDPLRRPAFTPEEDPKGGAGHDKASGDSDGSELRFSSPLVAEVTLEEGGATPPASDAAPTDH
uniref:Phorbol-ester/DAG-type domain-containing protein n=1 Tax=Bicosoecida sp. CB-2014 TaxID=1486930 RepID=A0A7S1C8D7_9STRA|mmetsp:Transcript_14795/g.51551  ORF Transcript_14795/g.51551 Transcript_14795/m.51551 type:complete len:697 (+) Transcript_14795:278-2368(+)